MNYYNCIREHGIFLPIRGFITPFREFISGNFSLFFKMIFSIDTPYLFIIISSISTAVYVHYYKDDDDNSNKNIKNNKNIKII